MLARIPFRFGLLPAVVMILLSQAAWAVPPGSDTMVMVSSMPAARAGAVSDPVPPPPGDIPEGHVLFAPTGANPGDQFGNSVGNAGDVNGDGYTDVIVGAWAVDNVVGDEGSAYVYYGGPGADAVPDWILRGEVYDGNFGTAVASAGDMNGDGYGDVIVGAWRSVSGSVRTGRAFVFYGGPGADTVPDLVLSGQALDDHFGNAVSSAGDLNADGFSDVIVGAPENDAGGTDAGRVYVFFGGAVPDNAADLVLTGAAADDRFGYAVSRAGDFNGDGFADVVVGAYLAGASGRAYVFFGGPGLDAIPDRTFLGQTPGDRFGLAVGSAGDMNGDGSADLIVSADMCDVSGVGFNVGRAYVFHGGPGSDAVADLVLTGAGSGDQFGTSVAAAGDMNGDGFGDLIVGAWLSDARGLNSGRAYVYFGGLAADAVADLALTGEASEDRLGIFVAGAGDFNADGGADVIVGAYFNDFAGGEAGRAYVMTMGESRPPVVTAPGLVNGTAGILMSFTATASDADGDAITSLSAAPLPSGATFTANGTNTSGTFSWTPAAAQVGGYNVIFTASNALSGSAVTHLQVSEAPEANRPPTLSGPAGIFGAEGVPISVVISASDPDGDHVTLAALNRPVGSLFIDQGNNTGSFNWTPGFGQAGTYAVTFTGRDDLGATATPLDLSITVDDVNRAPTAVPGGPYAGVIQVPITFNGTGSSDPDGTPLNYLWSFGDLATATGVTPSHSYATGGTFTVTLTVDDGSMSDDASTIATIQDVFPARAFTTAANRTLRLGSGKATWCTEIEPVGDDFLLTAVIPSTITMKRGTGQIFAQASGVSIGADKDANGIPEMTACFSKADLRTLFAGLPKGTSTVTVTLEGDLNTGGRFRTTLTFDVVSSGGALAASLSPNPLNPNATLTFVTSRPGRVHISIFDLQGRLVRTLEPGASLAPGYHDVPLDGRNDRGEALPSGAYFYRIQTAEGVETGRFTILK